MAVYDVFVNDFFIMHQPGTLSNPSGIAVKQTLTIHETASTNFKIKGIAQTFNFAQHAIVDIAIKNILISQFFGMTSRAVKDAPSQIVTQIFAPWQVAKVVLWEKLAQTLKFNQSVSVAICQAAYNTLIITQTVATSMHRGIGVGQTLVMYTNGIGLVIDRDRPPNPYSLGGPNGSPE